MSSSLSGWITFCSTFTFGIPVKGFPAQPPIRVHQEKKARVSRKRRCRVPRETPLSAITVRKAYTWAGRNSATRWGSPLCRQIA